eukprot:3674904-Prymnesium_polylepis.1
MRACAGWCLCRAWAMGTALMGCILQPHESVLRSTRVLICVLCAAVAFARVAWFLSGGTAGVPSPKT